MHQFSPFGHQLTKDSPFDIDIHKPIQSNENKKNNQKTKNE